MLFYIYFSFSYSPGTDARPSFFLELFGILSVLLFPEIIFTFLI